MFISDCLSVNGDGNLTIGGADAVALAGRFGTPLYCVSEDEVRTSCRAYTGAMREYYGPDSMVAYASKALNCKEMCRLIESEGMGLDVASGGELYTAMSVGFPAERLFLHGNNKTMAELEYALECGVGHIVVDNLCELESLDAIARAKGVMQPILLRVKPGVEAHTHEFFRTGRIDSKFGFALGNGEALEGVREAVSRGNLTYDGLHCHIGSQIFDAEPFCEAARVMLRFIKEIEDKFGAQTAVLNLGGGFGVKYTPQNEPSKPGDIIREVSAAVAAECAELGISRPKMVVEPGRAIIAPAGVTLYTVGCIKEIKGVRTYVSVDGGLTDNPRYALYRAEYTMLVANKAGEPANMKVTVSGRNCESDPLQENTYIQQVAVGDILATLGTGAYNYSMASNYNRVPRPAMVMIKNGEAREIIRRETYEDIIKNDL
jgi:diaminopimelate decarboxylase